jgi:hypothetical protein
MQDVFYWEEFQGTDRAGLPRADGQKQKGGGGIPARVFAEVRRKKKRRAEARLR